MEKYNPITSQNSTLPNYQFFFKKRLGLNCLEPKPINCSSKSLKKFKFYATKFYNYFFHHGFYLKTEKSANFFMANYRELKGYPQIILSQPIDDSTYLLTLEINLYNKETEVWTILKGTLYQFTLNYC
jgi:hypothetical protein